MNTRRARKQNEHGFFTIWVLGLCVMVLFVGGLSFDLWHSFSDRRALAAIVDGAAVAAADQIDLDTFRADSSVVLDQGAARAAAAAYLDQASADSGLTITESSIAFENNSVVVQAKARTDLTLTHVFVDDGDLTITVTGTADPQKA